MKKSSRTTRHLVVVLGDQLDLESSALDGFDKARDSVWMAEAREESTHVRSHRARIALFLSAMRHFRGALRQRRFPLDYTELTDRSNRGSLAGNLERAIERHRPERIVATEPGEWRVREALERTAGRLGVPLEIRPDRHFLCSTEEFAEHCEGRKSLRMEFFYREMRKRTGVLMDDGEPLGGEWNFDRENRESFGEEGPQDLSPPIRHRRSETTREVLRLVEREFPDHPGSLENFNWPVTPQQAQASLQDFVENRLARFGAHQDAIWGGEPFLHHSLLSAAMNLKLLNPRDVIAAAEKAHHGGDVPLAAAEGFIRQILGWREYVRGIYWRFMPEYLGRNHLRAQRDLPSFYWTGETEMACLRDAITQTLDHGYAHHIQRLMVTGLFALLLGVHPRRVHEWYLAIYVDAIEWVELPNTLGMSQFGDGGVMASKPYAATGKYIDRMSNHCAGCRFDPAKRTGEDACPFTTLYWDFLDRHRKTLASVGRMKMQMKNLDRIGDDEMRAIRRRAAELSESL